MKKSIIYLFLTLGSFNLKVIPESFIPPQVYIHREEPLENSRRLSSYPYLAGDTFRALAQFFIDELQIPFDPEDVRDGDIIFLKTTLLEWFCTVIHPRIKAHYILLSHNSDEAAPNKFSAILDDEKLIAWFAQNVDLKYHPKLFPIPIGLSNQYWPIGNTRILDALIPQVPHLKKDKLLYLNCSNHTNPSKRGEVYRIFNNKKYCYKASRKNWQDYLIELGQSKFVLSPHGNGLDCCRTWETLYMGSIPIVKTSSLDSLYADLPVIIVNDWNEVTEEFLNKKWEEMKDLTFNIEKIYADWWLNQIKELQQKYKAQYKENVELYA
jgi:hypothetical protein